MALCSFVIFVRFVVRVEQINALPMSACSITKSLNLIFKGVNRFIHDYVNNSHVCKNPPLTLIPIYPLYHIPLIPYFPYSLIPLFPYSHIPFTPTPLHQKKETALLGQPLIVYYVLLRSFRNRQIQLWQSFHCWSHSCIYNPSTCHNHHHRCHFHWYPNRQKQ